MYIVGWLSHNIHIEIQDKGIPGMSVSIHNINTSADVPICISIEDIQAATQEYLEL